MASRPFGLKFGRLIFEFGIRVVPDLSTAVGNRRSPSRAVLLLILHGTTARAILPRLGRGTTAGCPIPSFPTTF